MIIKMQSEGPEDIQKVLHWAQLLIDSGAKCRVYIGGKDDRPEDIPEDKPRKSLEDAADEVIAGIHGIGQQRIDSLAACGYSREERIKIQQIVNERMKGR